MSEMDLEVQFRQQVCDIHARDAKSVLLSKDEYYNLIEELKVAVGCGDKAKTNRQYYILKRYEILQCGDVEKLIKRRSLRDLESDNDAIVGEKTVYFAHNEEMYDIIKRVHLSTGLGGRDKM